MRKASPRSPVFPLLALLCLTLGAAVGIGTRYMARTHTDSPWVAADLFNPTETYFGKDRINILVMGVDDNWTQKDQPYTKGARTDTILVLSLDFKANSDTDKAFILSVPRDSRVHIAGAGHMGKINGAFATGGAPRAMQTVANFLDVPLDYYVVLKMDTTRKLVDSVGGVDLNVEDDMDYDDNWGHLHIHLKKGPQHLTGEQAVGYIRFRHDKYGEGDFGRMRRQQQLLHALADKMKNPLMLAHVGDILNQFRQSVVTNLTDQQLMKLALDFKSINTSQIKNAYVPGSNQRIGGTWYLIPDDKRKKRLVDWLLKGDAAAEIPLVKVAVRPGAGGEAMADSVRDNLRAAGFDVVKIGADTAPDGDGVSARGDATQIIDYDQIKGAGSLVAKQLDLTSQPVIEANPHEPVNVEVEVGRDLQLPALASRDATN